MFCSDLEVTTKPFKNQWKLKDSSVGSRRNTGTSVGTFESLQKHCQQQLVALFAPAWHLRSGRGEAGILANVCTMNGTKQRAKGYIF